MSLLPIAALVLILASVWAIAWLATIAGHPPVDPADHPAGHIADTRNIAFHDRNNTDEGTHDHAMHF